MNIDCHFICKEQVVVNGDTDELWFGVTMTQSSVLLEALIKESTVYQYEMFPETDVTFIIFTTTPGTE